MERFSIVEANLGDFDAVKSLMLTALQTDPTAFSYAYSDYANNSNMWWQNYLYGYLTQANAKLYVAQFDSKVVGMVGILLDSKNRRKHVGSIVWFYVSPDYRKYGLGQNLLKTVIDYAYSLKTIKKLTLLVNATQNKALGLYKGLGFEIVGTLKSELLVNGEYIDEYVMEKFL